MWPQANQITYVDTRQAGAGQILDQKIPGLCENARGRGTCDSTKSAVALSGSTKLLEQWIKPAENMAQAGSVSVS